MPRAYQGMLNYGDHREQTARRQSEMSRSGRDIGEIPPVVNPERRARAEHDLLFFFRTYLSGSFPLAFSADHLTVIAKLYDVEVNGGLSAVAMPRGTGKTTMIEGAALHAILYGLRRFVVSIAASETLAEQILSSIKSELEHNDLLLDDFPEVCYPIRALEGIANRCAGQLYRERTTAITWTAREIVLPTIVGSKASGTIMRVAGITGAVRGMKVKGTDGANLRPDFVLLDDPQTDESAKSPSQCTQREQLINGAVLNLAGPGVKIACICACTVIVPGDLSDRLLDRQKNAKWQGIRTKLVYTFPVNDKLWQEYAEIRKRGQREETGTGEANEFYLTHRDEMDEGARTAWEERFNEDEISAIQNAMNLKIECGDAAFNAEYQNDPVTMDAVEDDLVVNEIIKRLSGVARGKVPDETTLLTAFIDVHKALLYWGVVAWDESFGGSVIEYRAWPDQNRPYFTLADAAPTMQDDKPGEALESQIYAAVLALFDHIFETVYVCDNGNEMQVSQLNIDAGWGSQKKTIFKAVRASKHRENIRPSHGHAYGPNDTPIEHYKPKQGEKIGDNWIEQPSKYGGREIRFDTNHWKTFIHSRLSTAVGSPSALTLFGREGEEETHRMIADHWTSEFRQRVKGKRTVDLWKLHIGRDNHLWDVIVGAAVAASMRGMKLLTKIITSPKRKKKRHGRRVTQMKI